MFKSGIKIFALFSLFILSGSHSVNSQILVTPEWLAARMTDPDLIILQVASVRADYMREHIPGARFLWPGWLAESNPELSFELPSIKKLKSIMEDWGINNTSNIVISHQLGDALTAARMYITLDYLGMGERTSILDGGLESWKEAGKPVTQAVPQYRRGKFKPAIKASVIARLEDVKAALNHPQPRIVDGRSAGGFNAGGVGVFRPGHIPGAINLPFSLVFDAANRYQPADTLRSRFSAAGLKSGDQIITYCTMGRAACPVYIAAKILGHPVQMYDGSMEEWSRREDLPVENTSKK